MSLMKTLGINGCTCGRVGREYVHVALSLSEMNVSHISHYLCARNDIYMQQFSCTELGRTVVCRLHCSYL